MPARFGFLGPKRRAEAIDLAKRSRSRLTVQLSGLCQERFVVEVFHFKKRRCAFASGGCEDWRIT